VKTNITVCLVVFIANPLFAQHERYELGLRLRQFEKAWDQVPDPAGRKRALGIVVNATNQFFSLKFGEAGKTLDAARWALKNAEPRTDDQLWVASLMMKPEKRIFDESAKSMKVTIDHFYKVKGPVPVGAECEIQVYRTTSLLREGVKVPLTKLPVTVDIELPEDTSGNLTLRMIGHTNQESLTSSVEVARIRDPKGRLAKLRQMLDAGITDASVKATVKDRIEWLSDLLDGGCPETDFPYESYLATGEGIAARAAIDRFPRLVLSPQDAKRADEFWLSFAVANKQIAPVRIGRPPVVATKTAVPVVFALHGAGGSENMFFDTYGDGHIVEECMSRNWMLVATRSPGFTSSPPVAELIEQIDRMQTIDRKNVFLVGHSMGAGQVVDLCQKHPGLFAGAAVLGGGGRLRNAKAFESLPTFIGVGDKDFAFTGAKSLNQALSKDAKQLTFKTYPNVEHLVIVREALPDVFAMFDESMKAR
jgi:predicted esterase